MRAEVALVVLAIPLAAVLLGLLTYRVLRGDRHSPPNTPYEEDPVIEEARKIRAESRETKIRIETDAARPTEEDWLRSLGMERRRNAR